MSGAIDLNETTRLRIRMALLAEPELFDKATATVASYIAITELRRINAEVPDVPPPFEACGLGICCKNDGHPGRCST